MYGSAGQAVTVCTIIVEYMFLFETYELIWSKSSEMQASDWMHFFLGRLVLVIISLTAYAAAGRAYTYPCMRDRHRLLERVGVEELALAVQKNPSICSVFLNNGFVH